MVGVAVRRKRPCSECRRWFLPEARVGERQRTCGSIECKRARHRRVDRAWRTANRDYDRDRRWRLAIAAAKLAPKSAARRENESAPVSTVPWDVVQDEMKVEGLVIIRGIVRVLGLYVQDEMRRQAMDITEKFGRHAGSPVQEEMEEIR